MPLGTTWKSYLASPTTIVWPALFPPANLSHGGGETGGGGMRCVYGDLLCIRTSCKEARENSGNHGNTNGKREESGREKRGREREHARALARPETRDQRKGEEKVRARERERNTVERTETEKRSQRYNETDDKRERLRWPPTDLNTTSASWARISTSLPFPSSPHCAGRSPKNGALGGRRNSTPNYRI